VALPSLSAPAAGPVASIAARSTEALQFTAVVDLVHYVSILSAILFKS
jgi:hypothetical protein